MSLQNKRLYWGDIAAGRMSLAAKLRVAHAQDGREAQSYLPANIWRFHFMIRHMLFGITTLAFLSTAAWAAAGQSQFEMAPSVPAPNATALHLPPSPPPGGTVTIFDNINRKQPQNEYNCCAFYGVIGPDNLLSSHMLFDAMGFTPTTNLKVTEIDVAVSYNSGVNEFSLALYNDKGGVPGTALKAWTFTNLPPQNSCCQLTIATAPSGIPVVAGQHYWVVVRTDHASLNTAVDWNMNVLNTTTHYPFAQYCSNDVQGTPCTTPNDVWTAGTVAPAPAFAVFGTP
jgi:hypothetical protein